MKALLVVVVLAVLLAVPFVGGYNNLQRLDEGVTAAWSEVVNQYQRRADLVPNLVNTVKGYASHEAGVLEAVTASRARVGSIQATPELVNNPQAFAQFEQAQSGLGSALSRLMVVSENYPQLKADASFRDLMAQLEGTENRITVARGRYITTVQQFNTSVRVIPGSLIAMLSGMKPKANFTVENEKAIGTAPKVDFGAPAPAVSAPVAPAVPAPAPAPATP